MAARADVGLPRRAGVGSFRRNPVPRSPWRGAERRPRHAAVARLRTRRKMAGMGAEPLCGPPARPRRRNGDPDRLRRPCEPSHPIGRSQPAVRSGVVGARLPGRLCRAETGQRSRHRVRGAAADRRGAGVPRPLRSSRCRDAVAAGGRPPAARRHAARQRRRDARPRSRHRGGRLRLASEGRTRSRPGRHPGSVAALVGARPVRSQQDAMGGLRRSKRPPAASIT